MPPALHSTEDAKEHQCAQQRPRDTATTKAPMSPADLAAALNARGVATARGGSWHAMSVKNMLGDGRRSSRRRTLVIALALFLARREWYRCRLNTWERLGVLWPLRTARQARVGPARLQNGAPFFD